MSGRRPRLWVDTDVGRNPDDAVALLLAAAHPGIDLVGVSIVGDDPAAQAITARSVFEWCGRGDVPIVPPGDAPAALADAAPDVVVAIGPLGNVAAHVSAQPEGSTVVLMGGLLRPVHHRGAVRQVEWNFSRDPRAAAAVLACASVCTLVPLDATVAVRLDQQQRDALATLVPPLAPMFEAWLATQRADGIPETAATVYLHDPVALLVAAGEAPVIGACSVPMRLVVEADGRLVERPDGAAAGVVVSLDGPAVIRRTVELLGG